MEINPLLIDYGVHLNTVIFPFTINEIADSLEKRGYELSPSIHYPRPVARFAGGGEIARKGKTVVQIDGSAQLLLIIDVSTKSVIENFEELVKIFQEDYKVNLNERAKFFRFTATFEVITKKKPFMTINNKITGKWVEVFSTIMKDKLSPVEIKMAVVGQNSNSENWFDFNIRPNYERNDRYVSSIIYRNVDKQKTMEFIQNIEQKILEITKFLDE